MNDTDDLPCREFVELVTDYLEEMLPPALSARFEAHLDICDGCRLYLGQMRLTIRALAHHEPADAALPASLKQELLRRFAAWQIDLPRPGSP